MNAAAFAVYACVTIITGGLAYLLWQIPVQVSDCINNIGTAFSTTWPELIASQFETHAFLRPLIHPQTKVVLDLAPGWEFVAFRAIHIVQVFALFWLFVRAIHVRTWTWAAAALAGTVVVAGSHTFITLVNEGYPINNYMTVALCAAVALNVVVQERPRWWTDLLVVFVFLLALGTIESGLLIWVLVAAGLIAGFRGVSWPAAIGLSALVVGYFVLRFVVLEVGTPGLDERASGFLLERLEPPELQARFGANPYPLYAYNVVAAFSSVMFSEPRSGVFRLVLALGSEEVRPWLVVNLVSGLAVAALVIWATCAVSWRQRPAVWSRSQRLLFIAAGVVAANAVLSYPYAKDQVMSTAGIFYGLAAAAAIAGLAERPNRSTAIRVLAIALVTIVAATWSWRTFGVQHRLTHAAFAHRNDWAAVDTRAVAASHDPDNPEMLALLNRLRNLAIGRGTAYPELRSSDFLESWFEH